MMRVPGASETDSPKYRPDIDGLRALAVLPVLLFHAQLGCPGGFVGVDIFFVISGFLISSLIFKELDAGHFSLIAFWERRIRRILPAVTVVVLATIAAAWCWFMPPDFESFGKSVGAQALLVSNVFFYRQAGYFAAGAEAKPLLHTWSLAVEEQFYLFYPLLLVFLARSRRRYVSKSIIGLAVGSFALSVVGSYTYAWATFYLLPTRAWELLIGAMLVTLRGKFSVGQPAREAAGWLGLGLVCYPVCFYDGNTRFPGLAAMPPCLGAALIIFSSESKLSRVGRILAFKPVVFIGLISYSLYLWHWPLLAFAKYRASGAQSVGLRTGLLLASTALAMLSWKYIETPFRQRRIFQKRRQIFSFAGVVLGTLLVLGFVVVAGHGFPARIPAELRRYVEVRNHRAFLNDVSLEQALAGQFGELGSAATNQPIRVLIWGDSHAMSVTPVLDELCRQFSRRGIQATHSQTTPVLDSYQPGAVQP